MEVTRSRSWISHAILKKALYLTVFSTKVLIGITFFLRLLLETDPPLFVVIETTRRTSRFRGIEPATPVLQSSALPT